MALSSTPTTEHVGALRSAVARRNTLLRAVALAYAAGAVAYLIVGTPFLFARLTQSCIRPPCTIGQLSPVGMQALLDASIMPTFYTTYMLLLNLSVPILGLALALTVVRRSPIDRVVVVFTLFLGTCPIAYSGVPDMLARLDPRHLWVAQVLNVGSLLFWPLFSIIPDGRFVPRWSRWLLVPLALYAGVALLQPPSLVAQSWYSTVEHSWLIGYSLLVAFAQWYRYRHVADAAQRKQLKWVMYGVLGVALGVVVTSVVPPQLQTGMPGFALTHTLYTASLLFLLLTLWNAVLRHHLFAIELVLNRALVYAALTASVVALYALIVGGIGTLLHSPGNLLLSLVAAGTIGVIFQPLRARLQRGVDRLLYGARAEPYRVLTELSHRLAASIEPEAVMLTLVEAVRDTLKLPYAAIVMTDGADETICAGTATSAAQRVTFPLHYQHKEIGQLVVVPRAGETALSAADKHLLTDLAHHAGTAIHAVQLTDDLRRSRAQLVTAREEERRRLRRDLHDGLGPALATITLQADTARDLIAVAPDEAAAILAELTAQAQGTTQDVRRLIYALRPPVLDDLGLLAALEALAASLRQSRTHITVIANQQMPPLPAAVDVALYRIVQEALTNVIKHADAATCCVRLQCDAAGITISVVDDGRGFIDGRTEGIGLRSLRERAEELGGRCTITGAMPRGTNVCAWLPLRANYGTDPPADR